MKRGGLILAATGMVALAAGGGWLASRDMPSTSSGGQAAATPGSTATPAPAPAPPWTRAQLRELATAVEQAGGEGLRPADYDLDTLRRAVDAGQTGPAIDRTADAAALALAHDYAAGHVRNRRRFNWYIDPAAPAPAELAVQIAAARDGGRLSGWLRGLLPTGADYRALRDALAETGPGDPATRDRIIANMERWRWLPRDFGRGDRLYVNLPTYHLDVIEGGRTIERYKAVIGATDMPTPALSAPVRQVIANPDWIVPQSIVRRSNLRPGASSRYIFTTRPDGTMRVRQKPGPGNALGRVKIEFPNRLAIYFHDTPAKSLFGASERAFSHGCVRVQGIEALAASIVARPDRFDTALQGTRTQSFRTARPWRADIVYLTLVRAEGGGIRFVGDPYRMDAALAAALEGRKPRVPAPAPTEAPTAPPIASPSPPPEAPPAVPTPAPIDTAPALPDPTTPANDTDPSTPDPQD